MLFSLIGSTSNNHGGFRKADKAFIFSLHDKEGLAPFKSMANTQSNAIYLKSSLGPTFGEGYDIHIADKAKDNIHSFTNFGVSYNLPSGTKDKLTILAGSYYFTPDEVEVFYLP